jgi:proteasome lid subunit RPN8/RPN11
MTLQLSRRAEQAVRDEGKRVYPNECCGVLLGTAGADGERRVTDILPVTNARESGEQYHRFVITPEDFMKTELYARKRGVDIVGVYHSHPDHPAAPSDYDREHALPFYSYVIVAVENGKATELTSWTLCEDRSRFTPESVTIHE